MAAIDNSATASEPGQLWAVETHALSAGYGRHNPIIEDVNLQIADREFFALIGPNGGGKTTLVRALLGLLPIQRGGIRIYGKAPSEAAPLIGYVPQFATCKRNFPITVARMVELGLQNSQPKDQAPHDSKPVLSKDERVSDVLQLLGLRALAKRSLRELSGGQLQRALIAQALVRQPKLLILDEPTASIDPGGERALFELFETLLQSMTIVLVSHDVHFVTESVTRVGCVNRRVHVHTASALAEMDPHDIYGAPVKPVAHHHS